MFPEAELTRVVASLVAAFAFEGAAIFLLVRYARTTPRETPGRLRKIILRALFATAATLLFLTLLLPTTRFESRLGSLDVVLDDSASMTRPLDDGADVHARAETLLDALKSRCKRQGRPLKAQFLSGNATFSAAPASPLDDLDAPSDSRNPGARLILTDGIPNPPDATPRPDVARVVLGASRPALNWRLDNLTATPSSARSGAATVEATIELEHADAPRDAVVELWRKRADAPPTRVWSEKIAIDADAPDKARAQRSWTVEDATGTLLLAVVDEADAATFTPESFLPNAPRATRPKETCLADNARTFSFDDAAKTRVLLIDDLPRWEYRYLRETLSREPTVELKTVLLSRDPRAANDDPSALSPDALDRRTLARFDVVVVGDLDHEEWQNVLPALPEVVTRDGATTSLWFAGAERLAREPRRRELAEARLAPGTPVEPAPREDEIDAAWNVAPTPFGRRIWSKLDAATLPELTHTFDAVAPRPGSAVLLVARRNSEDGAETPLLVAQSLGKNAVLWQGTDEMWRLQTLDDKSVYRTFVLETLDYLTSPDRPLPDDAPRDPLSPRSNDGALDVFDYFTPDNATRLATLRELENVAADATDAALDLRDLDQNESLKRFDAYLDAFESSIPDETTPVKRPILPLNLLFPLVVALFLMTIFL